LDGVVHSFADNAAFGDYGPTIILQHCLEDQRFYTLYGHLTQESLEGVTQGMRIRGGQQIGSVGSPPTNGDWPPHLHFQIISNMLGLVGDFPGVAARSRRDYFLSLCPDPSVLIVR
jgi:murein DD-endopeptidase MepM/ murein hydrolase activator NlpD